VHKLRIKSLHHEFYSGLLWSVTRSAHSLFELGAVDHLRLRRIGC
jgi:hypothetical protein